MNVIFYNRDYTQRISPIPGVSVDRYSWHMTGGPQTAYLNAPPGPDGRELTKLLRCPVEIYGSDGRLDWWGYVNKVTFPHGKQAVGLGLDEMYNYIIVSYSSEGETAAASDATSIAEYGQKEFRITESNATQTEAEQERDLYLADHKYARTEIEFSGGRDQINIECYGWYSTLGWKYFSDTDTTNTENTAILTDITATAGQFLRGTIIEDIASITSNPERDGRRTALTYVNELLGAGTSNTRPLLAYVDRDRYLHVYERAAETTEYLLRDDGRLEDLLGAAVPDEHCKTAVWVRLKDLTNTLGGFSAIPAFFIESAEYNARENRTTYRPAGAFEQIRLAKFMAEIISGDSGGSGGVSDVSLPYTPYPAVVTATSRPRLCRYGSHSSDIAALASSEFIPLTNTDTTTQSYLEYTFLTAASSTSHSGWILKFNSVLSYTIWFQVYPGSGGDPTTGFINCWTGYGNPVVRLAGHDIIVPAATPWVNTYLEGCVSHTARFPAGSQLRVKVANYTDANIRVNVASATFELLATLAST